MRTKTHRKICPICRKPQEDERIVSCENCKVAFVSMEEGFRLLSRDEVSDLASALLRDWRVRVLRWFMPIATVVGVSAAALFLDSQAGKRLRETTNTIQRAFS